MLQHEHKSSNLIERFGNAHHKPGHHWQGEHSQARKVAFWSTDPYWNPKFLAMDHKITETKLKQYIVRCDNKTWLFLQNIVWYFGRKTTRKFWTRLLAIVQAEHVILHVEGISSRHQMERLHKELKHGNINFAYWKGYKKNDSNQEPPSKTCTSNGSEGDLN